MKKTVVILIQTMLLVMMAGSCAVLSKTQQERIMNLAVLGGEVSRAPGMIIESLSEVRMQRGLFITATIADEQFHIQELEAMAEAEDDDSRLARKFNAGVEFLNSYLYALRSLANDGRWSGYGTELRSLGRTLDKSLAELHEVGWMETDIPENLVKKSGYALAELMEGVARRKQMHILRDYLHAADTLIGVTVDSMVVILKSGQMQTLIAHEQESLRDDYRIFLKRLPEQTVSMEWDRMYLDALASVKAAEDMRRSCISGLQAFKRAHHKMVEETMKRQDIEEVWEGLKDLAGYSADLSEIIRKETARYE